MVAKMYFQHIMQPSRNLYSCVRFFETVIKNFNSEEQQTKKTKFDLFPGHLEMLLPTIGSREQPTF